MRGARNHPPIGTRERGHELAAEKASTVLPVNVRDLAVYRVSWTVGCSFCVDFGAMLHRLAGLDLDQLKEGIVNLMVFALMGFPSHGAPSPCQVASSLQTRRSKLSRSH